MLLEPQIAICSSKCNTTRLPQQSTTSGEKRSEERRRDGSWAYLPDVAEAFARPLDRRDHLGIATMAHFAGHVDRTGTEMAQAARTALGRPPASKRPFPWMGFELASLFSPSIREARELMWLRETSLTQDNRRLIGLIGEAPRTPLGVALAACHTARAA